MKPSYHSRIQSARRFFTDGIRPCRALQARPGRPSAPLTTAAPRCLLTSRRAEAGPGSSLFARPLAGQHIYAASHPGHTGDIQGTPHKVTPPLPSPETPTTKSPLNPYLATLTPPPYCYP
eukprot:1181345-Prorocentrum_minimum.AAC.1